MIAGSPVSSPGHAAALAAAAHGWHVFPCQGKQPAPGWKWAQWHTADPARIAQWFRGARSAGIACGPSGLVVVDLDTGKPVPAPWNEVPGLADGAGVLEFLAAAHDAALPDTFTVRTPSDGLHLYFQAGGHGIRNSAGQLGPMVDVRGDGGYVIAAGSVRDDGAYELVDDTDPAQLPVWLVARLAATAPPPAAPPGDRVHDDRWVQAAVEDEAQLVAAAPVGQRNHQLNRSAWILARFVLTGQRDRDELTAVLLTAATMAGLPAAEAARTIRSALESRTR
jgi:Bifunctional DNA primase/polymerase, N-terminal